MIIPIFVMRVDSSMLAYDSTHSVPGISLPPGDAKSFSLLARACPCCEEDVDVAMLVRIRSVHC